MACSDEGDGANMCENTQSPQYWLWMHQNGDDGEDDYQYQYEYDGFSDFYCYYYY